MKLRIFYLITYLGMELFIIILYVEDYYILLKIQIYIYQR